MGRRGRESELLVRNLDHALAKVAGRQHGVLAVAQLTALGLSQRGVQKRVDAGRLHRLYQGVYAIVPRELLTREGHWMAAVLACGPRACSRTARLPCSGSGPPTRARIDVTVATRSARRRARVEVHRSTKLTRGDVTRERGIPCTSVARTLRNPNHRGAAVVKRVLAEHYIGSTPTANQLEEAFFAICRRAEGADPEVNQWIDLGDVEPPIWADFVWREQQVIVETDGARVHGTAQARQRDPRHDQRALLAGWTPMRAPWRLLMRRPWELERVVQRLVR